MTSVWGVVDVRPHGQKTGASHEQVVHVLRHSGAEGAVRGTYDAEMQARACPSSTMPKDPDENLQLYWGKIVPVEVV
jgi:hypothetical protein